MACKGIDFYPTSLHNITKIYISRIKHFPQLDVADVKRAPLRLKGLFLQFSRIILLLTSVPCVVGAGLAQSV
jgi:hypothetical protein